MKKIVFLIVGIVVLVLIGGGFFYWWQNQADVRELNKTLPEGVKIVKSLFGEEYRVVNKIDNYEFKIPPEWQGIDEIAYIPERAEEGYAVVGIEIAGEEGEGRIATINRFRTEETDFELEKWAKNNFETFGLVGDFTKDKIGEIEVAKTQESVHLLGMYVYFFKKDSAIYALTCGSEEFIHYIITRGKW